MKLDLWNPSGECVTVGHFGWVWLEGTSLRAGPGPEFGNEDPEGKVVAEYNMGYGVWIYKDYQYSDMDVQSVSEPDGIKFIVDTSVCESSWSLDCIADNAEQARDLWYAAFPERANTARNLVSVCSMTERPDMLKYWQYNGRKVALFPNGYPDNY